MNKTMSNLHDASILEEAREKKHIRKNKADTGIEYDWDTIL